MKLAWCTDIHLNFVDDARRDLFYRSFPFYGADGILLGGDIAEAPTIARYLREAAERTQLPIYFVLGNHDFYRGSIAGVRNIAQCLSAEAGAVEPSRGLLRWLSSEGIVALGGGAALIGHDGWADGRLGNASRSRVMLNDYMLIEELRGLDTTARFRKLAALGDESAAYLGRVLADACREFRRVILLTHVPPYAEACWHEGELSNGEFLPHFASLCVGETLTAVMREHPDVKLSVLCGHTHSSGVARIMPNLTVWTGGAVYGAPEVRGVVDSETAQPSFEPARRERA